MGKLTHSDLTGAAFSASVVIGAGFGFLSGGLSNLYVGIGVGLLAFVVAFAFITNSDSFEKSWRESE